MPPIPFFVLGAPRSGTTLTRNLLRALSGVYLPPDEIQVLPAFVARARDGADPEELAKFMDDTAFAGHMRRRGIWPGREAVAHAFTEVKLAGGGAEDSFRALVLAIADREEVGEIAYWGDKTPENVFHLELIAELWPDLRVLNVVRDPRATVLSMHESWGRSILRSSVVWRDAIRATDRIAKILPTGHLHTLSYESLTADPQAELGTLAEWIGVAFDPSFLESFSNEERWGNTAGAKGVQQVVPKWESKLGEAGVREIEEICFTEMKALGYMPKFAAASREPGATALKLAKLGDAGRVLHSYAKERGWPAAISYKMRQWRGARQS